MSRDTAPGPDRLWSLVLECLAACLVAPLELWRRLKKLHWVAIRVFGQYLLTPRSHNDLIAKMDTCLFHLRDTRGQVLDFDNEPVPSAGRWPSSVRHRASS